MKKTLSILLAITILLTGFPVNAKEQNNYVSNFGASRTYKDTFKDNPTDKWYHKDVKNVYELGVVNGTTPDTYNPDGTMLLAEVVVLAVRINEIYMYGEVRTTNSSVGGWYHSYVQAAHNYGILEKGEFDAFRRKATRAEIISILGRALPPYELEKIRNIESIPDVKETDKYYKEIISLYEAGILSGNDAKGTFYGDREVKRSEVAALLVRLLNKSARLKTYNDVVQYGKVDFSPTRDIVKVENYLWDGKYAITPEKSNEFIQAFMDTVTIREVDGKVKLKGEFIDLPEGYKIAFAIQFNGKNNTMDLRETGFKHKPIERFVLDDREKYFDETISLKKESIEDIFILVELIDTRANDVATSRWRITKIYNEPTETRYNRIGIIDTTNQDNYQSIRNFDKVKGLFGW